MNRRSIPTLAIAVMAAMPLLDPRLDDDRAGDGPELLPFGSSTLMIAHSIQSIKGP